ncbi:MAG: DUF1573 domain-containing protein [Salibacteraceae bacterium]
MNNETRDYIKIGLLAIISACLVYGTFFKKSKVKRSIKSTVASNPRVNNQNQFNDDLSVAIDPEKDQGSSSNYNFKKTTMAWDNESHNFGTVKQHTENTHVFTFTNTGSEPLIIQNAQGSCGCTVPDYPKEPIMPGSSGEIKVKYSPGTQIGGQTKTVAITSNTEPGVMNLYITADVEEAPDPIIGE